MTSAGSSGRLPRAINHREEVMGTIVTFDFYNEEGLDPRVLLPLVKKAAATLHRVDKVFSTWKPDSPLSRLRRGEVHLGEVPGEVVEILEKCKVAKEMTAGWFDPWALPGGVDPTGYVKGWAAQLALEDLRDPSIGGVMVNAAGDIASFGGPTTTTAFRVGIVDPWVKAALACTAELRGAIATSGSYERGDHLMNPFTGRYETSYASASVTGPDLGLCDALATALVVGGDEVFEIVEGIEGYEALVLALGGEHSWTTGFPLV